MESEEIESSSSFFPFLELPDDLILMILSEFCSHFDLRCLSLVGNQQLFEFTTEEFVWKRLTERRDQKEMKEEKKLADCWKEHFKLTRIECFEELDSWEAHSDFINCLVDLGEGLFASGSSDKTIKIWELSTLKCLSLEGHTNVVTCLSIFKEDFLVSGSYDGIIKLWDLKTGECIRTIEGYSNCIYSLCILGDNIVSGCNKKIKVWNPTTGECLRILDTDVLVFSLLEFEGNLVVGDTGNIHIRDGKTFEILKSFKGHTGDIGALTIINGKLISSGFYSGMEIWDLGTGECEKTLYPHKGWMNSFVVSSDDKLITGSNDKTIKVLDPSSWKCIKTFTGHTDSVKSAIFVQNKLVSCSWDRTIKVWGTK